MRSILRALLTAFVVSLAVGALPPAENSALACPNCKMANETNERRPKAYMYSILFMIGMPATIFTGFSLSFYRMTRRARLEEEATELGEAP